MGRMITLLLTALLWQAAWALDIDEKLTLRLLKLSKSKKTILINRGIEDGLLVGDHAKFYLTTGMIARGVLVKTSPARSVWSLYRIINPNQLVKDKVVNLKIATAVKVTPDPTKMVMVEPIAKPGEDIPISPDVSALELAALYENGGGGGEDDEKKAAAELGDQISFTNDASSLGNVPRKKGTSSKSWELVAHGHFNGFGQTIEGGAQKTTLNSQSSYDLGLGVEKYFLFPGIWREKVSLHGLVHLGQNNALGLNGASLGGSFWGIEFGLNYHLLNSPRNLYRPIAYGTFGMGSGASEDNIDPSDDGAPETLNGNIFFYHVGLGVKYYAGRWGGKIQADYYRRTETYVISEATGGGPEEEQEETRTLSGPRLLLGLLHRF